MKAYATQPELPPVEDIALEVAWLSHARLAIDAVKNLGMQSGAWGEEDLWHAAEDLEPGQRIDSSPLYPKLVISKAAALLPGPAWADAAERLDRRNLRLAETISQGLEVPARRVQVGADPRSLTPVMEQEARVDAAVRLRLAARQPQGSNVKWRLGVIVAAGFFDANIKSPLERRVYQVYDRIAEAVEAISVRPFRIGIDSIYDFLNNTKISPAGTVISPRNQREATPHEHFWNEIASDRDKLELRRTEIGTAD